MPLTPEYGETPLPDDELASLLPEVVRILGQPVHRAAVYDLEQGVQEQVAEELLTAALEGSLQPSELLTDYFLKDLHGRLYGEIWTWAGKWRTHDVNIGVAYEQIAVDLRNSLGTMLYRWENTDDWTHMNWVLSPMPRQSESTHSLTETDAPQGFSRIWCSLRHRIPTP